jgi:hypothetical protein
MSDPVPREKAQQFPYRESGTWWDAAVLFMWSTVLGGVIGAVIYGIGGM